MSTPTASELVAGLGAPSFSEACDRPECGWRSGWYHSAVAANEARTDHQVMRHGARRRNGVDELHRGVVAEWRDWCRVSDIGID